MKNKIPLFAGLLLASFAGYAQTVRLTAQVPFAFSMGDQKMLAGVYILQRTDVMRGAWKITGPANPAGSYVVANPGDARRAAEPQLVFHRYGDTYLLSEIWTNSSERILELPMSREEKQLLRPKSRRPGVITIAMR